MPLKEIFVNFKPNIGCLMTHMAAWTFVGLSSKNEGRDIFECSHCDKRFYYPTKKKEEPVYR